MANIYKLHHQWYSRPKDERYVDMPSLYNACKAHADASFAENIQHGMLNAVPLEPDKLDSDIRILLGGTRHDFGELKPTNWSFQQLCTSLHVPTNWAKNWSCTQLVVDAINFNAKVLLPNVGAKVLSGENGETTLRAVTGPDYGRFWDYQYVSLIKRIVDSSPYQFDVPSDTLNDPRQTTLYASDRDVFGFLCNEDHYVTVKDKFGKDRMLKRGFIFWNSEVGKTSAGFMGFLFDYLCQNRIIWDAHGIFKLAFRHTKYGPERISNELPLMLKQYISASPEQEQRALNAATEFKIGSKESEARKWLQNRAFTAKETTNIIEEGKRTRGGEFPDTIWEAVAAGTSYAKSINHTDVRVDFEKKVSKLLTIPKVANTSNLKSLTGGYVTA